MLRRMVGFSSIPSCLSRLAISARIRSNCRAATPRQTSTATRELQLTMTHNWPWLALAVLGAYHGLNPAMGWLFALALGLQEKRRSAVIGALLPIALGHAAAIT